MKDRLIIIGIAILLICVGFSGCNEIDNSLPSEKDKFVGAWSWTQPAHFIYGWDNSTGNITFFENGTVKYTQDDYYTGNKSSKLITTLGEYEIVNGLLKIQVYEQNRSFETNYSFYENNQKIILSSPGRNTTVILIKKNE